jgi:hypothetical protein
MEGSWCLLFFYVVVAGACENKKSLNGPAVPCVPPTVSLLGSGNLASSPTYFLHLSAFYPGTIRFDLFISELISVTWGGILVTRSLVHEEVTVMIYLQSRAAI